MTAQKDQAKELEGSYHSNSESENDSEENEDEEDASYDDSQTKRSRHGHEMPHGSRTNYKGHWSKEEVNNISNLQIIPLNLKIIIMAIGPSTGRCC